MATQVIMVGEFKILEVNCKPHAPVAAIHVPTQTPKTNDIKWADLEFTLAKSLQRQAHGVVKVDKHGTARIKRASKHHMSCLEQQMADEVAEKEAFMAAPTQLVTSIIFAGTTPPSMMETETIVKKIHTVGKRAKVMRKRSYITPPTDKSLRNHGVTPYSVQQLCRTLGNLSKRTGISLEVVGKTSKATKLRFTKTSFGHMARVQLKHHDGRMHRRDLVVDTSTTTIMQTLFLKTARTNANLDVLTHGSSGLVFWNYLVTGQRMRTRDNFIIVRGRCNGILVDARAKLSESTMLSTHHYSTGDVFWRGFNRTFLENKPINLDHVCSSDFSVEECGSIAALICQSLLPCGKITCRACAAKNLNMDEDTFKEFQTQRAREISAVIISEHPNFACVSQFIDRYFSHQRVLNPNVNAYREILKIVGGFTQSPYTHIQELNEILVLGGRATPEQLGSASAHLLEITRFVRNRTDNIKKGSLALFRNKISAKAHVNTALMCDNQLDRNGNLIWGERGYHAKRFFSNYFDIITPGGGYKQYIERRVPNGIRKLAIGNLIVTTNLEALREQLEGESIEKKAVTKACVSMSDNNYKYPCCCVTLDDGTPLYSTFIMPTKNHLVIGNSGDPKFLDLPADISTQMYIAKSGYCYINIFLAMLVNVDESDAKDFTKKVRDIIVPDLGEWPTLIDVATSCSLLSAFYPATSAAELPRILVDHDLKTMHVIDSYGSLNTGYHVLKANTIRQLIQFASNSLDSEMKHYRVGGTSNSQINGYATIKMLAKAVYRPKLMKEIIHEQPYMLVMSLMSPGILIALANSGALEMGIHHWIREGDSLVKMAHMLRTVAQNVSVARATWVQQEIISDSAQQMLETILNGTIPNVSYFQAIQYLTMLAASKEVDAEVRVTGYYTFKLQTSELLEKTYLSLLEDSWQELSYFGRFQAIRHSRRYCTAGTIVVKPERHVDLGGIYATSYQFALAKQMEYSKKAVCQAVNGLQARFNNITSQIYCKILNWPKRLFPDLVKFINTMLAITVALQLYIAFATILRHHQQCKQDSLELEYCKKERQLITLYDFFIAKQPYATEEEFMAHVDEQNPDLSNFAREYCAEVVLFQAKASEQINFERIIAFISLVLMMFDRERSDCVYRSLTKLKSLMSTVENTVQFQSLDDIGPTLEEKNMTIDFDLDTDTIVGKSIIGHTFKEWWDVQLNTNRIVPHYRTEGHFMEFTRANAPTIAHQIAHDLHTDIMLRGAVGSGKSTGLPYHLSKKGTVLLLEPTRPLAENVTKQLKSDPFHVSPTLRMRGMAVFGSTPIHVMTTGFALHYLANNLKMLSTYDFIIIDEFHVHDSNAIALRNLLHEHNYQGKLIKVSATPPGREVEFSTQYPVEIRVEDQVSFQDFVKAQGNGSNLDLTSKCDNLLVYVASYNEVDQLSKLLLERHFLVTKVDGRSMKLGQVEIITKGSANKKHFIVATNIIENGVTLDIDAVIDFGMKVVPFLDSDNRMISYNKVSISYGERIQRLGRVGRNKAGVALRIGHTEKGISDVPVVIATQAAFLCFVYGLPISTQSVTTQVLSNVTLKQARTMVQFELPIFYMAHLVRYDGTMHPAIHNELKKYKLRDSEIQLSKLAIPSKCVPIWMTGKAYRLLTHNSQIPDDVRVPFLTKEIPDKLHENVWAIVEKFKCDAGIGRMTSAQASKVAYTLETDIHSVQRTILIIDQLLEREMQKQSHFEMVTNQSCSSGMLSLQTMMNAIQSRYAKNHTAGNIEILQRAKAQLLEFSNLSGDISTESALREFGYLEAVQFQSGTQVSNFLGLEGHWKKSLITKDLLIVGGVCVGAAWMIGEYFFKKSKEVVAFQGYNKRQRQKLKFARARDEKMGHYVEAPDSTLEHYFGSAYTKKGKTKGKTHGMGKKNHRFVNMYGFDPSDYTFIRYVDPLTGYTLDESPYTDIRLIQSQFSDIREQQLLNDELERNMVHYKPGVQGYLVKDKTSQILKIDLTPHIPLKVCDATNNIAGHPDREGELRQTGKGQLLDYAELPQKKESVEFESTSMFRGVRDYNPISSVICQLENESEGRTTQLFGLGFGPFIITNQHLFVRNNGSLTVRSQMGVFKVNSTVALQMRPVEGRDVLIIKMPKDFPPFPQRLKFRQPTHSEKVCLILTNFQQKSSSSMVSETSHIIPKENTYFWKHWISTKEGHCGSPIVSTTDGAILGIHSLSNMTNTSNYFACFPKGFTETYLATESVHEWVKGWKFNANNVCWGSFHLQDSKPTKEFKTVKLVTDLLGEAVYTQGCDSKWLFNAAHTNIQAVAQLESNLVTKHTVKGKCKLFETYLNVDKAAHDFFSKYMGFYKPSKLNREAYTQDLMKYSKVIQVGEVDCGVFESALTGLLHNLGRWGFTTACYTTDEDSIYAALNMKAAVGALYRGKKRDYFDAMSPSEREHLLFLSCKRLYFGQLGVWNGSLKAELRPKEKVDLNKTRTFTAAPIETLLGGKVCVDDFNNMFYSLHLKAPWSVGMTKFYGTWNQLMCKLPDDWVYCDADGSQFDSSISPYMINAVLRIRLHFMEDWDIGSQMLQNLYTEIVYTPISTPDGTVVKKFKGNNSGQPSTVVDNTLLVVLAMHYALLKSGIPLEEQDSVCAYCVNGDDLLIAIRPDMEHKLDGFQALFSELGLNYEFNSRSKDKKDLWFMSHKAIQCGEILIPKLEEERIVSILEWDRSHEPIHRLEAICASMVESWGYPELTHEIRRFYAWVLEQSPYNALATTGLAPYIAESALKTLYTNVHPTSTELEKYSIQFDEQMDEEDDMVYFQAETLDASEALAQKSEGRKKEEESNSSKAVAVKDKDVDLGTAGTHSVPRLKSMTSKLTLPMLKGKSVVNLDHLLSYKPKQVDLSNARATHEQFQNWYDGVMASYELEESSMEIILNGFMVWCIENGTSPDINGVWTMMDNEEQVSYPLKPMLDHAKPSLRQIMRHFSALAEAYIEMRSREKPYMPRYGLQRNLRDQSLARYAFDFYEITATTPVRAKEAHLQMKAAALKNSNTNMFGLDGNVTTSEEDTERHTATDVNRNMHHLLGVKGV
nr:polyprotein [Potato virus A]